MTQIDLNRLRQALNDRSRPGTNHPPRPGAQVFVDREGKVLLGDQLTPGQRAELSEVPKHVFGSLRGLLDSLFGDSGAQADRLARDRETVRNRLPRDTREVVLDGVTSWVYWVRDEFGQDYQLAAYYDGDEYQVKLVQPALEGQFGVTTGHIFPNGRLCLRAPANGMPTLDGAFQQSVLLVNGLTALRQTGEFPFPSH